MHEVPSGLHGYVREDTYSVSKETGATTPLSTMSLRMCLICSWYSVGTFLQACWTWGNGRVSPDGLCPRHVAYSTE